MIPARPAAGGAFSLIEVVLALGVASFCLMAILGLLPAGLRTNRNAIQQATACSILSAALADLTATPPTSPRGAATTSPQFGIAVPANPVSAGTTTATLYFVGDGQWSTTRQASSLYRLTVTAIPNGAGTRTATFLDLVVSWPAQAAVAAADGKVETFAAFNRN